MSISLQQAGASNPNNPSNLVGEEKEFSDDLNAFIGEGYDLHRKPKHIKKRKLNEIDLPELPYINESKAVGTTEAVSATNFVKENKQPNIERQETDLHITLS